MPGPLVDDYYALLGVPVGASDAELRRAWRRVTLQWHPDRAGPAATAMFQRLSAAYAVLSNPLARAAYDRRRRSAGGRTTRSTEATEGRAAEAGARATEGRAAESGTRAAESSGSTWTGRGAARATEAGARAAESSGSTWAGRGAARATEQGSRAAESSGSTWAGRGAARATEQGASRATQSTDAPRAERRAAPGVMLARLSGPLNALVACGVVRHDEPGFITLMLRADEAAQGGMATISMHVEVRCPECSGAAGGCGRCGGKGAVRELFSAWLSVPPRVTTGEVLTPSVELRGTITPVRFRVRLLAAR